MEVGSLLQEITATYKKHGWKLERVLLRSGTYAHLEEKPEISNVQITEAPIDAAWFSRPSHHGREAWELRLLTETPYALFETFAATDTEEKRNEVRKGMEERMARES